MLSKYWNKREAMWWALIFATIATYAVAVLTFGADPDPMVWLERL